MISISIDCYFTSVSLATWALEKNITIVGTMRHDQKSSPKDLKPVADREKISVMNVYNKKETMMLACYFGKKKICKKNVIVLSTMHDNAKIAKYQRKNPSVHTMYDKTNGGLNFFDFLSKTHSTGIKSRRWPLNALALIYNTCRSNAEPFLQDNGIKLTNFEMIYKLRKELVLPAIKGYSQSNGLKITLINKARRVLVINEVLAHPQPEIFNSNLVDALNV